MLTLPSNERLIRPEERLLSLGLWFLVESALLYVSSVIIEELFDPGLFIKPLPTNLMLSVLLLDISFSTKFLTKSQPRLL